MIQAIFLIIERRFEFIKTFLIWLTILNFVLIGIGPELKKYHKKMTEMVAATPRGKYITIYSAKNVKKRIENAFQTVKKIMVASEIEGFTPEED